MKLIAVNSVAILEHTQGSVEGFFRLNEMSGRRDLSLKRPKIVQRVTICFDRGPAAPFAS